MRLNLASVFVIAVGVGIGARWWLAQPGAPAPRAPREPAAVDATAADHAIGSGGEPAPAAAPHSEILQRLDALRSRRAAGGQVPEGGVASAAPADIEAARRVAEHAASSEVLERAEVSRLLRERFAEVLPQSKLGDAEFEAMTDAVMRVRAARRALRALEPSAASAEVLASERQALTDALADFERASGVAPSDLTEVFDSAEGLSHDDPGDREDHSGEDADDAAPEYLSDYPPPH